MSYYAGVCLAFLFALLEAAVLPLFRVDGLQPNLVLVLLVAWLSVRGEREVLVLLPAAGLFLGLVDGAPLGTALLALSPLVVMDELSGGVLHQRGLIMSAFFVIVMTLLFHCVYLAVFAVQGETGSLSAAFSRVLLPTSLLNLAVLLPVYGAVALLGRHQPRASYV